MIRRNGKAQAEEPVLLTGFEKAPSQPRSLFLPGKTAQGKLHKIGDTGIP